MREIEVTKLDLLKGAAQIPVRQERSYLFCFGRTAFNPFFLRSLGTVIIQPDGILYVRLKDFVLFSPDIPGSGVGSIPQIGQACLNPQSLPLGRTGPQSSEV